jgi:hypothetical protein
LVGRLSGIDCAGYEVLRAGGFDPFAVFVEAHVEACGANDHFGGLDGAAVGGFKEEAFEDASDMALASLEKAGIVSVAIDGGAIGKVVVACNLVGAAPADEIAFDGVAVWMGTDAAAARRAEKSLGARDSFARPVVGYLAFRGALRALGYFLLLVTIHHTWLGISTGSRVARFVFVGMPHLRGSSGFTRPDSRSAQGARCFRGETVSGAIARPISGLEKSDFARD